MRSTKRARDLVVGDVVFFATRPLREIAEIKNDRIKSQYPPHREYPIVRVRWKGDDDFTWKIGSSDLVVVVEN